jgi:flagellar hook-length control protein FliK
MTDRIALAAAGRSREAVFVKMSTPDLGDLSVAVHSTGGRVDAAISASNDSLRQTLQQHAAQLGHSLSQRGLELNSLSFGSDSGQSTADSPAQHRPQAHQAQTQSTRFETNQDPAGSQPARAGSHGLDMRI